jgi:4-hydroxy-4-methyl-2-oxoglutarate aldolase
MLKVNYQFERCPDLLAKFDQVLKCYLPTTVFVDVQHRLGVTDSGLKPPFRTKGQSSD